jgi:hypothetical protein
MNPFDMLDMPAVKTLPFEELADQAAEWEPCGSRITCNPPVMNTDADYLVRTGNLIRFVETALSSGWENGGSFMDEGKPDVMHFVSLRKDDANLIVTRSPEFYRRFHAATVIATELNILDKPKRVRVFQAVLYGNV